jgi:hypothetical protein
MGVVDEAIFGLVLIKTSDNFLVGKESLVAAGRV